MKPLANLIAVARRACRLGGALLLCLWLPLQASAEIASQHLADVIRSSGSGTINLLQASGNTPIAASQLEAYRLLHVDNGGSSPRYYLSLGVDVNENNKGLETSRAQGITIMQLTLTVTRPSGTTVYSQYRTRTQALLAAAGSTQRSRYYTVLGEGGSSRITGSNAIQNQFDSTLDIFVPDSLADATAVVLSIRLLDVNKSLGDPESFYDYSGGYEDLALLNNTDAYFLNVTVASNSNFIAEAPVVETVTNIVSSDSAPPVAATPTSWSYYPSASGWYLQGFEDNYPAKGDYDFNDLVVAYRYRLGLDANGQVIRIEVESYLLADGAANTLDWHFRLPLSGGGTASCNWRLQGHNTGNSCSAAVANGSLDAVIYAGVANNGYFNGSSSGWSTNTECPSSQLQGAYGSVSYTPSSPLPVAAIGTASPWLYVQQSGSSIDNSLRDSNGFPYAMLLPSGWQPACERTDLGLAYPKLLNYLQSAGAQDANWYLQGQSGSVFDLGNWQWAS